MIEWNKIKYIDCLDEDDGLPSLPDKSIDLCISDIAWGVNYKGYKDNYPFKWFINLFNKLERVCKGVILEVGGNTWMDWVSFKKPKRVFYWYRTNSCIIYHLDYFLCYGNIKNIMRIREVIPLPVIPQRYKHLLHPTPKPLKLYEYILSKLKPKSVLDPFMGSGTTAEACIKLGIPYIGYEINPVYKQDMDLRKNRGISCVKSSRHLNKWLK